jgi:hypothetical protein
MAEQLETKQAENDLYHSRQGAATRARGPGSTSPPRMGGDHDSPEAYREQGPTYTLPAQPIMSQAQPALPQMPQHHLGMQQPGQAPPQYRPPPLQHQPHSYHPDCSPSGHINSFHARGPESFPTAYHPVPGPALPAHPMQQLQPLPPLQQQPYAPMGQQHPMPEAFAPAQYRPAQDDPVLQPLQDSGYSPNRPGLAHLEPKLLNPMLSQNPQSQGGIMAFLRTDSKQRCRKAEKMATYRCGAGHSSAGLTIRRCMHVKETTACPHSL